MTECDTDYRHAPAAYAVEKNGQRLEFCEHCTHWSPRLAGALTRDGWELAVDADDLAAQPVTVTP